MADRKVVVEVKVKLVIRSDEGVEISEVVNEMDYSFADTTGTANVEDSEVVDYTITDSK